MHHPSLLNGDERCVRVLKDTNLPWKDHKCTRCIAMIDLLCLSYVEVVGRLVYNKFCVYNLCTSHGTSLPPQPMIYEYKMAFRFGFHPKTKKYKVVRIVEEEYFIDNCEVSVNQRFEVCSLGTYTENQGSCFGCNPVIVFAEAI